jgi:hypothetical protein
MAARQRLQLGLLVGADHELARMQPPALEAAGVEVEHPAGPGLEVGVAREDPRALLPRLERAVVQPAPDRRRRRVGHALLDHQTVQLSTREASQRSAVMRRQLASDRDDLGDLLRGENGAGDPRAACPVAPRCARRRTFVACCGRYRDGNPAAPRSPCRPAHRPRRESSARAAPRATAQSPHEHDARARRARQRSARSHSGWSGARTTTSPPPTSLLHITRRTSGRVN